MLVKHDGTYYMLAEGLRDRVHVLSSQNGLHWKRHGKLDIRLKSGKPLPDVVYGTPTVWFEKGQWHLLYERNGDKAIWLATSKHLRVSAPVMRPGPEPYDKEYVTVNKIFRHKGGYYIYCHDLGVTDGNWTTNIATSST